MRLTCGILRHFQAFFWLRIFPTSKQNPRLSTGNVNLSAATIENYETIYPRLVIAKGKQNSVKRSLLTNVLTS